MTTLSPPALGQLSFFDPPSPARSAEASIISIAEYFKRKASERATHSAGNDQQISIAAVAAEERPASANSALSYFSPSVSPYPRQSTAPSSECAPGSQSGSFQGLWDFSARVETVANNRASPSMTGSDHGRTNSDVEEEVGQHRSSASTEVESSPSSGVHSPVLTYPYTNLTDSFRYFNRSSAPTSGPIFLGQSASTTQPSQPKVQPTCNIDVPSTNAAGPTTHHSAGFPNMNSAPSWVNPPELEFRTALKNTNSTVPHPTAHADISINQPEFVRMCHYNMSAIPTILRMTPSPTPSPPSAPAASASAQNSSTTTTRKPRPPLPALPTAKPPMIPSPSFASPPFMFNEELPKPAEDVGTPFAKAFPSAWTCRMPPQPSLPPSSPSMTARLSDAEENTQHNTGRESAAPTPMPPHPGWGSAQAHQNDQQHRWVPGGFMPSSLSDSSWDSPRASTVNPYNSYGVSLNNMPPSNNSYWTPYKPQPPLYSTNSIHSAIFGTEPPECWMGPNAYPPPPSSPSSSNNPISGISPPYQRRLRFASPPSPTEFMHRPFSYLPRPPIPTYVPPPPVRLSPPQVPMGDVPYQNYMYSSPAPVIPSVAPDSAHAGWYTKSPKYCFADATVVFRVSAIVSY